MRILFCAFFLLIAAASIAQRSGRKKDAMTKNSQNETTTPIDAFEGMYEVVPEPSRKRANSSGSGHNSEKAFNKRMDARRKTYRRSEKMLMTPEYSDRTYFGHKIRPKKRGPDKMKYCKECGIRH